MMDELESYEYLHRVSKDLPDGETTTKEGWVITMSGGKVTRYIEPIEENAHAKIVYDSGRGTVLDFGSQSHCFGLSEEGMDHAFDCMRYIRKYEGRLPITFEDLCSVDNIGHYQ